MHRVAREFSCTDVAVRNCAKSTTFRDPASDTGVSLDSSGLTMLMQDGLAAPR